MTVPAARACLRTIVVAIALLGGQFVGTAAAQVSVPGHYGTIQAAINAVVSGSLPDGTTINVQPGTYSEALHVASTTRSFTVLGVGGAASTVIDAGGRNAPALTVVRASGKMIFKGLAFRRGASAAEGGGFLIREASPSLVDCIFELSSAFRGAGGALITSNATFTRCIIRNNTALHFGGGLYIIAGSRPVFTASDIVSNGSGMGGAGVGNNGAGGGVFSHDSSPTFRGSRIYANASKFAAGGIFHMGMFGSPYGVSSLVLEDSDVTDNLVSQFSASDNPSEGGGIHLEDNASATLTRTRILRNRANTGAGLNAYRARYDIVDSAIEANIAAPTATAPATTGFGGGIAASSNNPAPPLGPGSIVNVTRTLVRNNSATVAGGGIAMIGDNFSAVKATLSLTDSVVSGNQSQSQGGGILLNRTNAALNNSLIIANTVSGGSLAFGGGLLITSTSSATVSGTTFARNAAGQYGGGIFMDDSANLQMTSSQIYDNSASAQGGGGLFVGPNGASSGTVQNSIIADNTGYQIAEHLCPRTFLTYQSNTITPRSGSNDIYFGGCPSSLFTATTVGQFNSSPSGRASGNNSNVPRFAHFLAAPAAGTRFTLAWSVARATSVTISGVGTFNNTPTGAVDVNPGASAAYTLTATASAANGGNYGAVGVGVVFQLPAAGGRRADGDFDGDGRSDLSLFRPSTGHWHILRSSTQTAIAPVFGGGGDIPLRGDYDGDGRADLAVFRPSTGAWFIVRSSNATGLTQTWGGGGDIPVPRDYDGDGKTDIAIFRPSTGAWWIINSSTGIGSAYTFGGSGDVPVPEDYDGDGKADVAIFRPSTGAWYIVRSSTQAGTVLTWGGGGDVPVPGDYDGDGKADIAVFRRSTGGWYIIRSSSQAGSTTVWGGGVDVAVPGDYDGDGKMDIAVFRPSTGEWHIVQSSNLTGITYAFGISGDVPILRR
jgi:hypothetical protein